MTTTETTACIISEGVFEGVKLRKCAGFQDEQGSLSWDGYRSADDEWFVGYADLLLMRLDEGGVRPFHYHQMGIDTMGVVAGSCRLVLHDMRDGSPTQGETRELILDGDGAEITFVQVPPLVAHAFQGLESPTVLVDLVTMEEQSTTDFHVNEPGEIDYAFPTVR